MMKVSKWPYLLCPWPTGKTGIPFTLLPFLWPTGNEFASVASLALSI